MTDKQSYLGDGIYASFEHGMIWLRAARTNAGVLGGVSLRVLISRIGFDGP